MHGSSVTVNAFTAHREWATRPPDERFESVRALYEAARRRRLQTEILGGDAVLDAARSPVLADALTRGAGRLETHVLSHRYDHLLPHVGTA